MTRARLRFPSGDPIEVELDDVAAYGPEALQEKDVVSFGPEPAGARAWLGRLAHGKGEAWIRLRDGREIRFAVGDGPHVSFRDPAEPPTG